MADKRAIRLKIAIRPERLNFVSVEKKANVLDCTIENITFLGSVVQDPGEGRKQSI